ncbi:hypothetical protein FRC11_013127 [Ceratobasidium sp. 423]|nr:hypothetical protein FRC11_013127 [Ceratobasidium sp. 423]
MRHNIVYDPPVLPNYIPVELKSVTGPPSNEEIASVHTALRISESFVNVPSIFDSDAHIQLSQHLFDLQFARHVERSIVKRFTSAIPAPHNQTTSHPSPDDTSASNRPAVQVPSDATLQETTESTETQSPALEQPNPSIEAPSHPNPNESNEIRRNNELMVEIRDTLQRMNRVLVGTQNSLARGFNSSAIRSAYYSNGISHDLGAHSLINDYGEVPETYNLPTFKAGTYHVEFAINDLTENILARYLRFYNMGEELIEEGEELKIKSGMIDNARNLLSVRLFLIR